MTTSGKFGIVTIRSGKTIKAEKAERSSSKSSSVKVNKHFSDLQKLSGCNLLSLNNKRKRKTLNCEQLIRKESSKKSGLLLRTNYCENLQQAESF